MNPAIFKMLINGALVEGSQTFPVLNPATGETTAYAPDCDGETLDAAVAAARAAFPGWAATPIEERRRMLESVAATIGAHGEELMRILTQEQGRPHEGARAEVLGSAWFLQQAAAMTMPVFVSEDTAERRSETRRVPIGVVGAIAPWNFPIFLAIGKVGPALLAGNTMVLKPSPFTPLTTLKIGEIVADLLPKGVLNIVSGTDALGPLLSGHPGIDKVSFTGSTQTGRKIMASAASTLKRITLELGGNDPAIVLPDVDVESVAQALFWSAFGNSGQICIATKRLYVHTDIYDALAAALVAYAKTVKLGDGAEEGSQLGPIQNAPQFARVKELIEDAKANGYNFLLGGEASDLPGYFVPVTLIDNPPENSRIVQEEQFGPVLPLLKFDNVDDAIARANASEYGLGASIWSADEAGAAALASRIQAGTVWINESQYLSPHASFGGHKQSGIGVENGEEGLLEYTLPQTVTVKKSVAA